MLRPSCYIARLEKHCSKSRTHKSEFKDALIRYRNFVLNCTGYIIDRAYIYLYR